MAAWTSRTNTLQALRKPKAPPLPLFAYVSIRDRAIGALDQANYEVWKSLWCPCDCMGPYQHVEVEPNVSMFEIKRRLREKSYFWCKPCLAFVKATLRKGSFTKRYCTACKTLLFDGDLSPNLLTNK